MLSYPSVAFFILKIHFLDNYVSNVLLKYNNIRINALIKL
ncbi:hypothetical protein NU09_0779 [Flavobacterium beibuense]|uniref:Uncharacterized protein n=1 Tax=Flavobacterium beibuense TaxID=657326 RepID=A0A444WH67_9FLAO|nr:hypothetical protein NU09_0779 [Flavobacterium beibuense]